MTPHFTLSEALKRSTATQRGISNEPNATQLAAVKHDRTPIFHAEIRALKGEP